MRKSIFFLFPVLVLSELISVANAGFVRWEDKEGNVHYSDTIPPDQIELPHDELNKEGVRIKSVPPVKTAEEVRKEKELERLRAEKEQLLEQQESKDRVLLRTFRSEDDINMARDGKIATIDVQIDVTKNNIRRLRESLVGLLAKAANLERAGKAIPKHLSDNITQTERAIRDAYATIVDREGQKRSIRTNFERDLARFRQLMDLPGTDSPVEAQDTRPILHNIVTCSSREECDHLWETATAYVRKHASTAVQTSSASIFITAPPATEQDVSLILSRINDKEGGGASLFLDLQCESSVRGREMCQGQLAQAIIEGFRPAIVSDDTPRTQPRQ